MNEQIQEYLNSTDIDINAIGFELLNSEGIDELTIEDYFDKVDWTIMKYSRSDCPNYEIVQNRWPFNIYVFLTEEKRFYIISANASAK